MDKVLKRPAGYGIIIYECDDQAIIQRKSTMRQKWCCWFSANAAREQWPCFVNFQEMLLNRYWIKSRSSSWCQSWGPQVKRFRIHLQIDCVWWHWLRVLQSLNVQRAVFLVRKDIRKKSSSNFSISVHSCGVSMYSYVGTYVTLCRLHITSIWYFTIEKNIMC